MRRKLNQVIFLLFILSLNSCTTYLISLDSFKHQFAINDSVKSNTVTFGGKIKTINCTDEYGHPFELKNSPSIEIRFTYGSRKKRTVFYFDNIFVNDTSVTGFESRFFSSIKKTIAINSIKKIEVQDGKKQFSKAYTH